MKSYIRLIKMSKAKQKYLILSILCAMIAATSMLVAPLYLRDILNQILVENITMNLVIVTVLYILGGIFTWISNLLATKYAIHIMEMLRTKLSVKIFTVPFSYLDSTSTGKLINNFTTDNEVIYDAVSHLFSQMFMSVFMMIGSLGLMIYLNLYMAIMVFVLSMLILLVTKKMNKLSEAHFNQLQKDNEILNAMATEFITEQSLIYAYNYDKKAIERFKTQSTNLSKSSKKANFISALSNPTTRVINNIIFIMIGFVIGYFLTDSFEIGMITSFIAYSQSFSKPINDLTNLSSMVMAGLTSLDKVFKVIDEESETDLIEYKKENTFKKGRISINHLFFSYNMDFPLIENLNLEIRKGDKVAIVGPTGAGKSTLINLLMRFYDADQGNIMIDYKNIDHISKKSLRESIGLVLQDPWLFEGSIKDNISYGKADATLDEVIYAAKLSGADDFIQTLKDGYDAKILEDGRNLSLGQRQLITIARALILDPTILILDEATSNVDRLMERQLQSTFAKIIKNKTSFFIAHRLSNIVDSTSIIVMDQGHIVEIGNHQELLEKQGFYYKLYHSQFTA